MKASLLCFESPVEVIVLHPALLLASLYAFSTKIQRHEQDKPQWRQLNL
jgi:hypothetical protein